MVTFLESGLNQPPPPNSYWITPGFAQLPGPAGSPTQNETGSK
jgi:hypothetical protein